MSLSVGARLGHYEVTAKLGEGGMGEVWEATDTKLNRQVALKILPEAFATDPDRLARFQREAQVLASLNHPGIAAIYGIEEQDDTRALVLELVEGPTLADRIAQGPIPVDEALPIAKQIAEALEAAHEAGVIHRDLKPANIKVREDGTVKVLDFGLAKALDPSPTADPSQSPTLTAAATQMGVIMGTAAYMSPEQARGKPVDKRADIWSFGVVLYEMLTGQRAFQGEDVSLTLAAVMTFEPDLDLLPETLSPKRVRDRDVLHVLWQMLKATGKRGVPQGGVISPLLSNLYLNEVDQMLERAKRVTRHGSTSAVEYARYADDLVVLVHEGRRWDWVLRAVHRRLREEFGKLRVEVNEEKSRVVDLRNGESFGFLGFDFRRVRSRWGRWRPLYTPQRTKRTALLRTLRDIF